MPSDLLNAAELAKKLGKSVETIFNWKRKGILPEPAPLPGRDLRWLLADIEAWQATGSKERVPLGFLTAKMIAARWNVSSVTVLRTYMDRETTAESPGTGFPQSVRMPGRPALWPVEAVEKWEHENGVKPVAEARLQSVVCAPKDYISREIRLLKGFDIFYEGDVMTVYGVRADRLVEEGRAEYVEEPN